MLIIECGNPRLAALTFLVDGIRWNNFLTPVDEEIFFRFAQDGLRDETLRASLDRLALVRELRAQANGG